MKKTDQVVSTPDLKGKAKRCLLGNLRRRWQHLNSLLEGLLRKESSYLHLLLLPRMLRNTSFIFSYLENNLWLISIDQMLSITNQTSTILLQTTEKDTPLHGVVHSRNPLELEDEDEVIPNEVGSLAWHPKGTFSDCSRGAGKLGAQRRSLRLGRVWVSHRSMKLLRMETRKKLW